MSIITLRECNLCDVRGPEGSMFEPVDDIDMCVSCLHVLKRAVEYGLVAWASLLPQSISSLLPHSQEKAVPDYELTWDITKAQNNLILP